MPAEASVVDPQPYCNHDIASPERTEHTRIAPGNADGHGRSSTLP